MGGSESDLCQRGAKSACALRMGVFCHGEEETLAWPLLAGSGAGGAFLRFIQCQLLATMAVWSKVFPVRSLEGGPWSVPIPRVTIC